MNTISPSDQQGLAARPGLRATARKGSETGFAGLLGGYRAETPVGNRSRTYAFSELGMFGHSHIVDRSRDVPEGKAPARPLTAPQRQLGQTAPFEEPAGSKFGEAGSYDLHSSQPTLQSTTVSPTENALSETGIAAAAISTAQLAVPDEVAPAGRDPSTQTVSRLRPSPPSSGPQLIVGGTDGALQIIARGQGDSAEDRMRLRRALDRVAAEFGMSVAGLHLNGRGEEVSYPSYLGGPHGARTR